MPRGIKKYITAPPIQSDAERRADQLTKDKKQTQAVVGAFNTALERLLQERALCMDRVAEIDKELRAICEKAQEWAVKLGQVATVPVVATQEPVDGSTEHSSAV